jgi:hypothetical protein
MENVSTTAEIICKETKPIITEAEKNVKLGRPAQE